MPSTGEASAFAAPVINTAAGDPPFPDPNLDHATRVPNHPSQCLWQWKIPWVGDAPDWRAPPVETRDPPETPDAWAAAFGAELSALLPRWRTAVAINETAARRGHHYCRRAAHQYISLFVNIDSARVLFATEGKGSATVVAFADDLAAYGGDPMPSPRSAATEVPAAPAAIRL
jgi:hypothetical protein